MTTPRPNARRDQILTMGSHCAIIDPNTLLVTTWDLRQKDRWVRIPHSDLYELVSSEPSVAR